MLLKQVCYGPHRIFWRTIWKLQTLPKTRIFCWRVAHDILPTYEKISTIRQEFKSDFPRCGACNETLIHTLKDCPTAREILVLGGLNNNLQLVIIHIGTIEIIFFRGKEEEANVVWERTATLCHDFRIHNLLNKPLLLVITADKKWTKPPHGIVKINFDATVLMKKMGYGMLARDSDDFVLGEGAGVIDTDM
ncbi:hypothetical protein Gohar_015983 [Gossypium harknessii]|uniref:Reverse transcriptase zinc-binding domain-containing protein n=1 Tax=Gossypium harknessii TaxID=34285 RepID=A0A7J9G2M2_9ROSI|nr:hypothetical protein [Gossypium harknessii]